MCKSPTQPKAAKVSNKKSNLDKVIEAVSKGFVGELEQQIDKKTNGKIKLSIKQSEGLTKIVNGMYNGSVNSSVNESSNISMVNSNSADSSINESVNKSISSITSDASSPRIKSKNGKKSKKEKGKDKTREKDIPKTKTKTKTKEKLKSKVKSEEKGEEIVKRKEKKKHATEGKIKRKRKVKSEPESNDVITKTAQVTVGELPLKTEEIQNPLENHAEGDIKIDVAAVVAINSEEKPPTISEIKPDVTMTEPLAESKHMNFEIVTNGVADTSVKHSNINSEINQKRKRRKEKHRNKHGPDTERSSSKEHRKKRKRKTHDMESPDPFPMGDGVPKIKIKFKALPLPGETATEAHCFYVPANMVRPREYRRTRPASVNSIEDVSSTLFPPKSPPLQVSSPQPNTSQNEVNVAKPSITPPIRTRRLSVLMSPKSSKTSKASKTLKSPKTPKTPSKGRTQTPVTPVAPVIADPNEVLACDVCHVPGTTQDLVKCDECKKTYHFGCLEPPLKKTPKRRGYSWHCADCDPTDKEDN